MEQLLSVLSGGVGGAAAVWLIKKWISERLKQSIQNEYAEKLESYKTELNSKIEGIKHENQVSQIRTSLFFDHQRNAFSELIEKIVQINTEWAASFDLEDGGLYEPVPLSGRREFEGLVYRHQLFLDEECLMALSLIMKAYNRSLPFHDDEEECAPARHDNYSQHFYYIEYLQPRIASIFREKIGMAADPQHLMDAAVLSAIELVNSYCSSEINNHPEWGLSTWRINGAADKVAAGLMKVDKLVLLLGQIDNNSSRDGGYGYKVQLNVKQTLNALEKCIKYQNSRMQ